MKCPRCQQDNPAEQKFCGDCGTPLAGASQARPYADLKDENEGLRRSLTESLEQQTATSEILRVISGAHTDAQPVFDSIVRSAARLLGGYSANVLRVVGDELQLAALTSISEAADAETRAGFPVLLAGAGVARHAISTRRPYIVADVETDPLVTPRLRYTARLRGFRSMLMVPMVHQEEHPIGVITVTRQSPGGYSEDEVALLQTFANQAVIAIENVRLFNETKEALEQQTATAQILRVISRSPTDIQPVLDAVTATAARVCGATDALIMRVEGQGLRRVAHFGPIPLVLPAVRPLRAGSASGRAIVEGRTIHMHDILATEAARD